MTDKEKLKLMNRADYNEFMTDVNSFIRYMNECDTALKQKSVRTIVERFFEEYDQDPVCWYEYAIDIFLEVKK